MHPAIENLKTHQRQLDMDGCEVGVSRQALDEALTEYDNREAMLSDCYKFLHSYYHEAQPSHDQPPEPSDEMSYSMIPMFVAIQRMLSQTHDEIINSPDTQK